LKELLDKIEIKILKKHWINKKSIDKAMIHWNQAKAKLSRK
jgi:hypothetical protein